MKKIKAVVFDWAGTMIDFGSFAPVSSFIEAFKTWDIKVSVEQARGPMGMGKRDHIKAIFELPPVMEQFQKANGRPSNENDIDRMFDVFVPLNEKVATRHAALVPGAADAIAQLRKKGIKIGSTTGYTRSIMANVVPLAEQQGYKPDAMVCVDDVENGRPAPDAMHKCLEELGVSDFRAVLKVDDTTPGIGEGLSIGCTTIGISLSGNEVGKTPAELAEMPEGEVAELRLAAERMLLDAGAHYVIDTVAKLPALVEQIEGQS
ncbi:MAG: phosphonoacetaldehyde hydrolase [Pseudomonadota bacterium]